MTSKDELRAQAREGQDSAEAAAPAVVVQVDPTPPTKPQAPPEVQLRSGCWLFDLVLKDLERVEAATVSLIVLNVLSSIGIVFLNKWLFVFLNFPYSTFVTCLHFITTAVVLHICAMLGMFTPKSLPYTAVLALSVSFCGFVVLTNLSLQMNSVGFYQIMKVLTTPVIVAIQTAFYGAKFLLSEKMSILVICVGVALATVTDFDVNLPGTIVALVGVLVTSFYQIWVGSYQKKFEANSMQLLYYQAPVSAVMLLIITPFLDDMSGIMEYPWATESVVVLVLSCLSAVSVNLSIFLLIGKTSPVTYNAVGHFKLVVILVGGVIIFTAPVTLYNTLGVVITVSGLIGYTHIQLNKPK